MLARKHLVGFPDPQDLTGTVDPKGKDATHFAQHDPGQSGDFAEGGTGACAQDHRLTEGPPQCLGKICSPERLPEREGLLLGASRIEPIGPFDPHHDSGKPRLADRVHKLLVGKSTVTTYRNPT